MTAEQCDELCRLADAIFERKPWEDLEETQIFTLQPAPDSPVYFASVMGDIGEHFAVAYYPGMESFMNFCACQYEYSSPQDAFETILLNKHLQASFELRKYLETPEKALLKAAGRTYRGRWPVFRRHGEARQPWPVDEPEAEVLKKLMAGTVSVLDRVAAGEDLLADFEEDEFFLLGPDGGDGTCRPGDLPETIRRLQISLDKHALDGLRRANLSAEMELMILPTPVNSKDRSKAPYFPFILILVDDDDGTVLGAEILSTDDGMDAAMDQLPGAITRLIRQGGMIPSSIAVRHPMLLSVMKAYGPLHGIAFAEQPVLPAAMVAMASMQKALGG